MTTADKLIQLNTDLGTINAAVTNQAELISLVREAAEWLPDKNEGEDISEESSEYTALVDQLEEAVDALPDATGIAPKMVNVQVSSSTSYASVGTIYYFDCNWNLLSPTEDGSISCLEGLIFYDGTHLLSCQGDFRQTIKGRLTVVKFESDGAAIITSSVGGSTD